MDNSLSWDQTPRSFLEGNTLVDRCIPVAGHEVDIGVIVPEGLVPAFNGRKISFFMTDKMTNAGQFLWVPAANAAPLTPTSGGDRLVCHPETSGTAFCRITINGWGGTPLAIFRELVALIKSLQQGGGTWFELEGSKKKCVFDVGLCVDVWNTYGQSMFLFLRDSTSDTYPIGENAWRFVDKGARVTAPFSYEDVISRLNFTADLRYHDSSKWAKNPLYPTYFESLSNPTVPDNWDRRRCATPDTAKFGFIASSSYGELSIDSQKALAYARMAQNGGFPQVFVANWILEDHLNRAIIHELGHAIGGLLDENAQVKSQPMSVAEYPWAEKRNCRFKGTYGPEPFSEFGILTAFTPCHWGDATHHTKYKTIMQGLVNERRFGKVSCGMVYQGLHAFLGLNEGLTTKDFVERCKNSDVVPE